MPYPTETESVQPHHLEALEGNPHDCIDGFEARVISAVNRILGDSTVELVYGAILQEIHRAQQLPRPDHQQIARELGAEAQTLIRSMVPPERKLLDVSGRWGFQSPEVEVRWSERDGIFEGGPQQERQVIVHGALFKVAAGDDLQYVSFQTHGGPISATALYLNNALREELGLPATRLTIDRHMQEIVVSDGGAGALDVPERNQQAALSLDARYSATGGLQILTIRPHDTDLNSPYRKERLKNVLKVIPQYQEGVDPLLSFGIPDSAKSAEQFTSYWSGRTKRLLQKQGAQLPASSGIVPGLDIVVDGDLLTVAYLSEQYAFPLSFDWQAGAERVVSELEQRLSKDLEG